MRKAETRRIRAYPFQIIHRNIMNSGEAQRLYMSVKSMTAGPFGRGVAMGRSPRCPHPFRFIQAKKPKVKRGTVVVLQIVNAEKIPLSQSSRQFEPGFRIGPARLAI